MISSEIQLSRLLFTLGSISLAVVVPQAFEKISGLLIIILLSVTVIPHGALDHIVFYQMYIKSHRSTHQLKDIIHKVVFYTHYLGIMVLWWVSWRFQMSITFIIFLALSAYHFGEVLLVVNSRVI